MGVLFLVAVLVCSASAAEREELPPSGVLDLKTLKSPSGRFTVIGRDNLTNVGVLRWADDLIDRIENTTGVTISFQRMDIRLVVRETETESSADSQNTPDSATNLAQVVQQWSGARLVQRFVVPGNIQLDRETVEELFSRMVFSGHVLIRRQGIRRPAEADAGAQSESILPEWFTVGLIQNLYPPLKSRNSEKALELWESGRMSPFSAILQTDFQKSLSKADYRAMAGMLVGWVLSLPDRKAVVTELIDSFAIGVSFPGWLMFRIPDVRTSSDLNDAWDDWILRQKRIVYEPGRITPRLIRQLKAEVLLYPDKLGIPLMNAQNRQVTFREWIDLRESAWSSDVARRKSDELRQLALGRGREYSGVVDAYCAFLDALARKKSGRRLEELLKKAETSLDGLEKMAEEQGLKIQGIGELTEISP